MFYSKQKKLWVNVNKLIRKKELEYILKYYQFKPVSIEKVSLKHLKFLTTNLTKSYNEDINLLQNINNHFLSIETNLVKVVIKLENLWKDILTKKESHVDLFLKQQNTYLFFINEENQIIDVYHYLVRLQKVLFNLINFFEENRKKSTGVDYKNTQLFFIHIETIYQFLSQLTYVLLGLEIKKDR